MDKDYLVKRGTVLISLICSILSCVYMYKPCDISTFLVFVNTYILLYLYIFIYMIHACYIKWYIKALFISLLTNAMSVFPFSQLTVVSTQVNKSRSLNVCSLLQNMWNNVICYTWVGVWLIITLIISLLFFVNILGVKCSEIIKKCLVTINWSDKKTTQKTFCVFF